jgi:Ca-activated chloride channel family protein
MYAGVQTGVSALQHAPASHSVRRLVLISDGHANVGPSDPYSLGNLAANATEFGVQVTGIGVGLDYDENTLGALAVRSSGRLYHLEHPHQMAQILEREVQLLASTVATDAIIEIRPAPGVTILEGVTTGAQLQGSTLKVPLGSVYAGQQREILFRARVDTRRAGDRSLATARFVYRTPDDDRARRTQEVHLGYEVTRDAVAAQGSAAPRVQAMVANYRAAEAQRQAAVALNRGDRAEAERQYEFAEDALVEGELVAPEETRGVIRERLDRVRSNRSRARRATTPAAARGAALESYDAAMDAEGY